MTDHAAILHPWPMTSRQYDASVAALDALLAKNRKLLDALEHLDNDAANLEGQDLRLHDLEQRLGAMLLGFGGGHNHLDDVREALAGDAE